MELNDRAQDAFSCQNYESIPPIEGVEVVALRRFNDDGGNMTELLRLAEGKHAQIPGFVVKQVNYSEMEAGAIKAFHLHHRQTDVWYVPPGDKILLILHDCRAGSPTEGQTRRMVLGDGNSLLVRIPPGVAHGARNLGTRIGRIVYFVDLHFSTESGECDEGRLSWDHLGAEIWEVEKA